MYTYGGHSLGNFGTVPRGTYGKLCPKPPPVLTPRGHMEPIVGAAVPRRSAELPPPCSPKDVPNDLSLRNLIPCSRFSASLASFSSCTLANSACAVSFSLFMVSRSALKAATSSDTDIILSLLTVPAPRRCLSYILLRCSGPRWPPYQLHHARYTRPSRCTRPLFGHGPSYKNSARRPPDSQLKRQYPLPTPGPIYRVRMRQLRQRPKEKEG